MLRKFLILGLGGSGGKTIRYIKQALQEWFRQVGWEGGMPTGWQFLHIDTPASQDSPVIPGAPKLLRPDEYLTLYPPGIEFETIVSILKDRKHDLRGWEVDHTLMHIPIDRGAGQFRAVGRMLGLYQIGEIKQSLQRKQAALMTPGASAQLRELTEKIGEGAPGTKAPPPIVIVVSSLAGGTGAGIIVDVCDVLRSGGDRWLDDSIGILYSADVFSELSQAASEGVQPNSAAAFSEILHGYYGGGDFMAPGGGPVQQRSGPAFPYLVGQANTQGVHFGDQLEVYRFMGRCLAAVMSDLSIQDDFTSYMIANWQASSGQFRETREPIGLLAEPPGYGGAFQALGFAEVELGVKRLEVYAERRITRDAVEWALSGHRRLIAERPDLGPLSEEERVDLLAGESFTRFLNDCQINERGVENNQILDSVDLSGKRIESNLSGVLKEIWEACGEHLGDKAKSQDWIDAVVEEVQARRSGILEEWEKSLRRSLGEWTREAELRIVEKVGNFIAEKGIPVSVALIEKAEAEMKYVSGELEEESYEEDQLSRHLRSDVESVLPAEGRLRKENPEIRTAINKALFTGVLRRHNSKLRLLASELVEDFRKDFLASLRIHVSEACDKLRSDIEDRSDSPVGSSVAEWPRHSPASDQKVPEGLIPGQSVKSLLDPEDFEKVFKELTDLSIGGAARAEKEQQRLVRKQALLGDPGQIPPRRWINQTDHWHPRDNLTLGENPKNRASFRIALDRDHVLRRANEWLHTEGSAWDDFLSQGLRSYLSESPTVPVVEQRRRERKFRRQLEAAFEAAEPLASVDQSLLAIVHPATELAVRPVAGEIPVSGLPVEQRITELLTTQFGGDSEKATRCLSQSEHLTKIPVYSSLSSAFHPIVFESLMRPIADKFKRAETLSMVPNFWKWRRARTLNVAAPIPAPTLLAMLRGWFTARLLGAVEIDAGGVRLHSRQGVAEFPNLLRGGSLQPHEALAELVEGLAIALPMAATSREFSDYLGPYQQLVDWGREPGTASSGLIRYQVPSRVLSEWLRTGENLPGRRALVQGADQVDRARKVARLLDEVAASYKTQYQADLEQDRNARHAWLGISEPINRALKQLENCVIDQTTTGPLL